MYLLSRESFGCNWTFEDLGEHAHRLNECLLERVNKIDFTSNMHQQVRVHMCGRLSSLPFIGMARYSFTPYCSTPSLFVPFMDLSHASLNTSPLSSLLSAFLFSTYSS